MKNKILQLFTKNQAKDKESSFDLKENWPGNGAKDTLNPPPFTSLSSALSWGRGTHLQTHHLTHLRVVFLRNQGLRSDQHQNQFRFCWYSDFFFL